MKKNYASFKEWAIETDAQTNHYYDGEPGDITALPYSYHLKLVVDVLYKFKDYLEKEVCPKIGVRFAVLEAAAWGHDLIEDARASYNQVLKAARRFYNDDEAKQIAEIIRAVTNYGRGRTREERMPPFIYKEIRETPGADIVKLADRGGNLKHGLIKGSNQKGTYQKEQPHFRLQLLNELNKPMMDYIEKLLATEI